jgi:hypothetical protein
MLGGCVTAGEHVSFRATGPQQQSIIRDGQAALVSRQKNSIVLVKPASREFQQGGRPVFVLGITNIGKVPVDFHVAAVQANQIAGGQAYPMQVIPYETLVQEERSRQVAAAILTGVAAAANSYSASRAGYGTYVTPRGHVGSFYSPTAAVLAQNAATAQNEALIASTIEHGQANMAALEQTVIKGNTLMPGEWYGGQLHLSPPANTDGQKSYEIAVLVGPDRHVIQVDQAPQR